VKRLPYRPQWYRRNTRFDAVLTQPLDFGTATVSTDSLRKIGMPTGESVAEVRLLTDLNSGTTALDAPVNAVLTQPVFSSDHRLLLPEGTMLTGHVKQVQRAKWFHRGGQLRFTFDKVEPPPFTLAPSISTERNQLQVAAAESDPKAHVKVDGEGNTKATESKSRFLAPAVAVFLASRAADNDEGHHGAAGANANYGGRTMGGFSGLGVFGSIAAQSSKNFGMALGYYGLGFSVFTNVISRGNEVNFPKNTAVAVRFGSAAAQPKGNQLLSSRGN
jgi:hypothetical protein